MSKVFKVHCEYTVRANGWHEAKKFVENEFIYDNYMEKHVIIDEVNSDTLAEYDVSR